MKKLIFLFILIIGSSFFLATNAQVSIRINIGSQPIWGPVGYDHVDYYYLPEIEAYYYVPRHRYIYFENGYWVSRTNLPSRYRDFDIYNTRKVVINEPKPYRNHDNYRAKYASKERSNEPSIRDSREAKYYANKRHPQHSKYKEYQRSERNNHNQGKGKRHK